MKRTVLNNITGKEVKFMRSKRVILMMIGIMAIFGTTACTPKEEPVEETTEEIVSDLEDTVPEETTTEEVEEVLDDIVYANMIPDPEKYFKNGSLEIVDPDGGKMYAFDVSGFEASEFEAYVNDCIEMGFNQPSYHTETLFGAYTEDGMYWVSVEVSSFDENLINVVCQKSKHAEESVD